jgi:hypothetical protein
MSIFAVLIGGRNSVFGWILVTAMGLVFLCLSAWKRWPRPRLQLRKTPHGWELRRISSTTIPSRNTSQAALLCALLVGVAALVVMWLLLRSR